MTRPTTTTTTAMGPTEQTPERRRRSKRADARRTVPVGADADPLDSLPPDLKALLEVAPQATKDAAREVMRASPPLVPVGGTDVYGLPFTPRSWHRWAAAGKVHLVYVGANRSKALVPRAELVRVLIGFEGSAA